MLYVAVFGDLRLFLCIWGFEPQLSSATQVYFVVHSSICVFFLSANSTDQVSKQVDCICEAATNFKISLFRFVDFSIIQDPLSAPEVNC